MVGSFALAWSTELLLLTGPSYVQFDFDFARLHLAAVFLDGTDLLRAHFVWVVRLACSFRSCGRNRYLLVSRFARFRCFWIWSIQIRFHFAASVVERFVSMQWVFCFSLASPFASGRTWL